MKYFFIIHFDPLNLGDHIKYFYFYIFCFIWNTCFIRKISKIVTTSIITIYTNNKWKVAQFTRIKTKKSRPD